MKFITTSIESVLKQVLFVLMFLITISVIWQVVSRYLLGNPASWPDEIARFSMIWIAMLGGVYVYAQGKHLAVTILPELWAGSRKGHYLQVFFHLLVVLLGVLVTIGGYIVSSSNFANGQLSSVLHINMGYVYLSVPVAGILLVFYSVVFIIHEWQSMGEQHGN